MFTATGARLGMDGTFSNGSRGLAAKAGALVALCLLLGSGVPALASGPGDQRVEIDQAAVARMERALARYRSIARAGGWPMLAAGPMLREGSRGPRVARLAARLGREGDLRTGAGHGDATAFTARLARAVRRFQSRHGLAADAVVGPETLAALNVAAARRAETLALNLARLRGLVPKVPGRAVIVNVPSATLTVRDSGGYTLDQRVIVGRPSWPTPLLQSAITHVSVNPFWYIPKRIARTEVVPKVREDSAYLARNGIEVFGGVPGAAAALGNGEVDWSQFGRLGYRLRQRPGPGNPLGKLRLYFPNPYDVFLHDSPAKSLFERPRRALSHGCVRLEDAFSLAVHLLAANEGWTAERLRAAIATGKASQITLAEPMPIFIVYLTAWVDPRGRVQFRRDIYGHDAAALSRTASRPCGPPGPGLGTGSRINKG